APEDLNEKSVKTRMIYSGPGAPVDPRDDPVAARSSLFANVPSSGTGTPMADRNGTIRTKLFAHLDGELAALGPRLCNEDKQQLDALRDGWNNLQAQIANAATAAAQCSVPTSSTTTGLSGFPLQSRLQMDVLAMALACDMTRVASIQWSHALSPVVASWLSIS